MRETLEHRESTGRTMPRPAPSALAPTLALLAAAAIWASSFVVMKAALAAFDPIFILAVRMTVAALCLTPFLKLLKSVRYRPGDWRLLAFIVVCEPGLYFLFEANALRFTSASQAGMVVAILPLMVGAAARLALKEPLSRTAAFGLALAVAGVVWLSAAGAADEHAPNPALGNFLEFLAMVCATGYMVAARRLMQRYSPHFITALQAVAGCAFYLPALALPAVPLPESLPLWPSLGVLYLGSAVTLLAYGCYNYGNSKLPAARASAFTNLIPVFTLLMGVTLLGETLTPSQMAAAALVIAGVFLPALKPSS
ncbi:MAG: DMT family transporter [Thermodesulfobacteriota bacterium]